MKYVTPLSGNYAPWLEDFPELMSYGVQQYQELVGQLSWAVEIGRMDIMLETLLLSSYLAMPRVGNLDQAFRIFVYFKVHPKRNLGFDPARPSVNKNRLQKCDWTEFCRDTEEAIPGNIPVSIGKFM